ncbi:MAG: tRNA pseudouridine(55) synthase TruB [Candidatus Dasytiphilus stammeri]
MSKNVNKYGYNVNGFILLDKPRGISSNKALQQVKYLLKSSKAGYIGTLDPLATGMLPICLGQATKFSQYLLNSDRRYHVVAKLGQRTDTADADGKIISEHPLNFKISEVKNFLVSFIGEIKQIPPMYSAIKWKSCPLYKYARQGIEITRKERKIIVYNIHYVSLEDSELELEIHCSKGTYIRTLVEDLGSKIGCGAHVKALRRLQVGNYPTERMITMDKLQRCANKIINHSYLNQLSLTSILMSVDSAVSNFPEINLLKIITSDLKKGRSIKSTTLLPPGLVRITEGTQRKFIGIAEINEVGRVLPRRLVV